MTEPLRTKWDAGDQAWVDHVQGKLSTHSTHYLSSPSTKKLNEYYVFLYLVHILMIALIH